MSEDAREGERARGAWKQRPTGRVEAVTAEAPAAPRVPVLSYCSNVHPGEGLEQVLGVVSGPAARVRAGWRPEAPMGVGLWLPREVALALATDADAQGRARDALAAASLFAYTVNAFPVGGFHAARVKRDVFKPTWMDPARLEHTRHACRALAALLPPGARGSVSTVPISFKGFPDTALQDVAGKHLGELVLDLLRLEAETGHEVSLGLEPEPLGLVETTEETIAFLEKHVFRKQAREVLEASGLPRERAEAALRRFVGVCVDACHLACQFEHLPGSLERLARAGVRVVKAQLSSALELQDPSVNDEGRARLAAFAEQRYLHQTLGLDGAKLPQKVVLRCEDLSQALEVDGALVPALREAAVLRCHFHVPLVWGGDEALGTTRPDLEEALPALAAATDHLEVETYTFDVLPGEARAALGDDLVALLVAELRWAEGALAAAGVTAR